MGKVAPAKLAEILAALRRVRFSGETEAELCAAVDGQLLAANLPPRVEVVLGPKCRIDRLVGNVGIEVKKGKPYCDGVYRQLERYADHARIAALVLVTERTLPLPLVINSKLVIQVNVHHGRLAS